MSPAASLTYLLLDIETDKHRHREFKNEITFSNVVQPTFCLY